MAKETGREIQRITSKDVATVNAKDMVKQDSGLGVLMHHVPIISPSEIQYDEAKLLQSLGVTKEEWQEAPSDMTPMADFDPQGEKPCFIRGAFQGVKTLTMGDREQHIWRLRLPSGEEVGIWGSHILDAKMFNMNISKDADTVIVYLGDQPTKRGLNPVKVFRVFARKPVTVSEVKS